MEVCTEYQSFPHASTVPSATLSVFAGLICDIWPVCRICKCWAAAMRSATDREPEDAILTLI